MARPIVHLPNNSGTLNFTPFKNEQLHTNNKRVLSKIICMFVALLCCLCKAVQRLMLINFEVSHHEDFFQFAIVSTTMSQMSGME